MHDLPALGEAVQDEGAELIVVGHRDVQQEVVATGHDEIGQHLGQIGHERLERLDHGAVRRAQLHRHQRLGAAADLPQVHIKDADGVIHPGVIYTPLPILMAPHDRVGTILQTAAARDELFFVSFSSLAQGCRTYDEYIDNLASTPTADLASVGVGLHGPRKQINKLVGSLPLLR